MAKKKSKACQAAQTRRGCQLGAQCPYSHQPYPTPPATPNLLDSDGTHFIGAPALPIAPDSDGWMAASKDKAGIWGSQQTPVVYDSAAVIPDSAQALVSPHSGGLILRPASAIGALSSHAARISPQSLISFENVHDADDIAELPVVPTTAELLNPRLTALPANCPGAPHRLAHDSIEKILDIQYRLLRADATHSFRTGVSCLAKALGAPRGSSEWSKLDRLLNAGGGQFPLQSGTDNDSLPLVTNVEYVGLGLDPAYGFTVRVRVDAPPGPPRGKNGFLRWKFWEESQRLPMGGLVAIVTDQPDGRVDISLALLATYAPGIKFIDRPDGIPALEFDVAFCEPEKGLRAAQGISSSREGGPAVTRVLVECPTLWEAVRPFLESLRTIKPTLLPFARYIKHGAVDKTKIDLPAYSSLPSFQWNMASLLDPNCANGPCMMDPRSPISVDSARALLHARGKLDKSQSDAVIEAITREMALVQGPPGTGKTFTGVELLRLLVSNNVGPIMLLAYTNHALDHILRAVIDGNVAQAIVRLGARSKDEIVSRRSLKARERTRKKSKLHQVKRGHAVAMRRLEAQMKQISANLARTEPTPEQVAIYMREHLPSHACTVASPPQWIAEAFQHQLAASADGWQEVRSGPPMRTLWDFWLAGQDIKLLEALSDAGQIPADDPLLHLANRFASLDVLAQNNPIDEQWSSLFPNAPVPTPSSGDGPLAEDMDMEGSGPNGQLVFDDALQGKRAFLAYFRLPFLPSVSTSRREMALLSTDPAMWSWSLEERRQFTTSVKIAVKEATDQEHRSQIALLVEQYGDAKEKHDQARGAIRLSILQSMKIVGATTTGAAKLANVIKEWGPKVLVVEEAGQVLESHILANLYPSIQHVIAIGDPLQLRPIVNCHDFSMNSARGRDLYRFDVSLMERLALAGLPMSQLQVQRRMRPTISSLIRNTLYPHLTDHPLVHEYPRVKGMSKNVFFLDHRHGESKGGKDGTSKSNDFEVEMACDLALHFLKQGCYSQEGDIVVLCAYLGQLKKMQQALGRRRVTVVLDERDQVQLSRQAVVEQPSLVMDKQVNATQQIYLRTVDNFQGEEAKIVILSLVRNEGSGNEMAPGTIGFLNFNNRVNVAMSRAKHGMYIMGNAPQLASRSQMWRTVIGDLEMMDAIGTGWPLACALHPHEHFSVSAIGDVVRVAPDGGCQRPCEVDMLCGHRCPRKCHPDDPQHRHVRCEVPCERKHAVCGHACQKDCYAECGPCTLPRGPYRLSCDHMAEVPCWQVNALHTVHCTYRVERQSPTCEHLISLDCGDDILNASCSAICDQPTGCCGKACLAKCGDCQKLNTAIVDPASQIGQSVDKPQDNVMLSVPRQLHAPHLCTAKHSICNHECGASCHGDTAHPPCSKKCIQQCAHKSCGKMCGEMCAPCEEPCTFQCEHQRCTLPCFMPCTRLPCSEPCLKTLMCGHPCPSVCGEPCERQICTDPTCGKSKRRLWHQRIDGPTGTTLREVCEKQTRPRLVALSCGHVFTPGYLDGHVGLHTVHEVIAAHSEAVVFTGPRSPATVSFDFPSCPLCSAPVVSPRYSRLTKWTLLDRQIRLSIASSEAQLSMQRTAASDIDYQRIARSVKFSMTAASLGRHLHLPDRAQLDSLLVLRPTDTTAISADIFHDKVGEIFAITGPLAVTWKKVTAEPFAVYKSLVKVVNADDPAYLRAVRSVIDKQVRPTLWQPASMDSGTDINLSQYDRDRQKIQISALLESVDVRLELSGLARVFSNAIAAILPPEDDRTRGEMLQARRDVSARRFTILAIAILRSARRDVDLAVNLSATDGLHRIRLRAEVAAAEVSFHLNRLYTLVSLNESGALEDERWKKMVQGITQARRLAEERLDGAFKAYEAARAALGTEDDSTRVAAQRAAELIGLEWKFFKGTLRTDALGYKTVMGSELREAKEILRKISTDEA